VAGVAQRRLPGAAPGRPAPAYSKPMIVPRMPLEVLPLPGVGVPVGGGVVGGGVVGGGVVGGGVVGGGGGLCLVFEGAGEDGWLAGVDGFPDFTDCPDVFVPGV
jgi:hypothetical protein